MWVNKLLYCIVFYCCGSFVTVHTLLFYNTRLFRPLNCYLLNLIEKLSISDLIHLGHTPGWRLFFSLQTNGNEGEV